MDQLVFVDPGLAGQLKRRNLLTAILSPNDITDI